MCGRYVPPDVAALERAFHLGRAEWGGWVQHFNVAPTSLVPMVYSPGDGESIGALARWGLIPSWWKQDALPSFTFNARSEEAAVKPMWRSALRHSRCLVPALGWYEWRVEPAGKVPYYIHPLGSAGLYFAGLWSEWKNPAGELQPSFAILTRAASPELAPLHNRMPVVLPPAAWDDWLAPWPDNHATRLAAQVAVSEGNFEYYPVSRYVNAPRNQGERCIEPAPL